MNLYIHKCTDKKIILYMDECAEVYMRHVLDEEKPIDRCYLDREIFLFFLLGYFSYSLCINYT